MVVRRLTILYSAVMMAVTISAGSADSPAARRPDTYAGRLAALASLETLNAELLSHDSATLTLERWCGGHELAPEPKVSAVRLAVAALPPSEEQRRILGVGPDEPVRYRRVALRCGTRVLSEAENWYVPARLTPEMNRQLDSTDVSFGRVVRALDFTRRTLSAELLWHPMPDGWELVSPPPDEPDRGPLAVPDRVLRHRAVLSRPDGTPFSLVDETYRGEVLAFGPRDGSR